MSTAWICKLSHYIYYNGGATFYGRKLLFQLSGCVYNPERGGEVSDSFSHRVD